MSKKKENAKPFTSAESLVVTHLCIGWMGLLVFLSLGIVLEVLHGLKLGLYLDVDRSARRLMWTLAHAHGSLFSLIHLGLAATVSFARKYEIPASTFRFAARCCTGSLIVMPLGFFLGGLWTYGGDPGPGVFLVPVGALLMLVAVAKVVGIVSALRKQTL